MKNDYFAMDGFNRSATVYCSNNVNPATATINNDNLVMKSVTLNDANVTCTIDELRSRIEKLEKSAVAASRSFSAFDNSLKSLKRLKRADLNLVFR